MFLTRGPVPERSQSQNIELTEVCPLQPILDCRMAVQMLSVKSASGDVPAVCLVFPKMRSQVEALLYAVAEVRDSQHKVW